MNRVPLRRLATVAAALALALTASCASAYQPTPLPRPSDTPAATRATAEPQCPTSTAVASYSPPSSVPTDLSAYPTVRTIKARGRLVVGVSADTLLLGARNPARGQIEGFDIAMAQLVAKAIFGGPKVQLKVINAAGRIPALRDRDVDLVARALTITCGRWKQIALSAEYLRAGQRILVKRGTAATTLSQLAGQRVCAPNGSTSLDRIRATRSVRAVPAGTDTECLVLFQQGRIDAISSDSTVLAGLAAQDKYAEVVGKQFSEEPYGLGMNQRDVDLVRYVNAVLARAIADGTWQQTYDRWLAPALGPVPGAPAQVYGRS
jgi:polar amino acid transport system substrate-binding protein